MNDIMGQVRAQANMNCTEMAAKGCDKTLFELNSGAPKDLLVKSSVVCPLQCGVCTAGGNQLCKDDFDGILAKQGSSCAKLMELSKNDCFADLHKLEPNVPDMNLVVQDACPVTCKVCHPSEVASANAEGVLSHKSHSSTSAMLVGLGVGLLAMVALVAMYMKRVRKQNAEETEMTITPTTLASL